MFRSQLPRPLSVPLSNLFFVFALMLAWSASAGVAQEFAALLQSGPVPYLQGPALRLVRGNLTAGDGADMTWGDYDGDGHPDVLLGSAYGDLVYYRRLPEGFDRPVVMLAADLPFANDPRSRAQISPELADLDGDHIPDLVLGAAQEVYFYRRTAAGMQPGQPLLAGEGKPFSRLIGAAHLAPCVVDLDGDDDNDLLLGDETGRVWWVEHLPGPGVKLAEPLQLAAGGVPLKVGARARACAGDWDRDGYYDVLVGAADGQLFWARGRANGLAALQPLTKGPLVAALGAVLTDLCPRLADVDGDEKPELLAGCGRGFVAVFAYSPAGPVFTGYLQAREVPLDVGRAAAPTVTDWDGNGLPDLVVGAEDGLVQVFRARRDGLFEPGEVITTPEGPLGTGPSGMRYSWPRLADLNGDGAADLIVGSANGQLATYLDQGGFHATGVFKIGGVPITARGISALSLADYDGDGDLDLFVGDHPLPFDNTPGEASGLPRYVLPPGGICYYENEAPKGGGMPVFLKGVRLTLYLGRTDRAQEDAALDASVLGPGLMEPAFVAGGAWTFLVGTRQGCFLFPSMRDRQYYPVPMLQTPRGELPLPAFPPLYCPTVAALRGEGSRGLLCGLAEYGFVCYYPPDQVPQLSGNQ